jgi:D-3-phosphoglycerate dehydrogenase
MINGERLKLMKHGAILLNFARDGLVDEAALLDALNAKRLRYYMCDFPTQLLQGHASVVALPHLGASTREAEDNCAMMVVDQVRDFLEQGNIANAVNFPDVTMPREAPFRVGIANANVPNMVGQISTAMAKAGLNIHTMLNKSKAQMAYTLVDTDSAVPPSLLADLAAIDGVLSVRYLPEE